MARKRRDDYDEEDVASKIVKTDNKKHHEEDKEENLTCSWRGMGSFRSVERICLKTLKNVKLLSHFLRHRSVGPR